VDHLLVDIEIRELKGRNRVEYGEDEIRQSEYAQHSRSASPFGMLYHLFLGL
jgi:hypothetical protein